MYFSDVDSAGHNYGPDSPQVNTAIAKVDSELGMLLQGLAALPFEVNLIITSDHVASVDEGSILFLEDWLDIAAWNNDSEIINGGAYVYFYSKNNGLLEL